MTFDKTQRTAATLGALGLLLLAAPSDAQTDSLSRREPTMALGQMRLTDPPLAPVTLRGTVGDEAIRPFHVKVSEAAVTTEVGRLRRAVQVRARRRLDGDVD